jgi:hypothetical protein
MASTALPDLHRAIAAEKTRYLGARAKLVQALAGSRPGVDSVDHLLAWAEEFGTAAALDKADKDPSHFGLAIAPGAEVADLLAEGLTSDHALNDLIAQRERLMRSVDPTRPPIYQLQGREFRLDLKSGTMIYLDEPTKPIPLTVDIVHTKDQPDPGRGLPRPSKDRSRSL